MRTKLFRGIIAAALGIAMTTSVSVGIANGLRKAIPAYAAAASSSDTAPTDADYSYTFASGDLPVAGGNKTFNGVTWTYSGDTHGNDTYVGFEAARGVQIGKGTNGFGATTDMTLTTSVESFGDNKKITKMAIGLACASSGGYSGSLLNGDTISGTNTSVLYWSSAAMEVTSGDVVFTFKSTKTNKAIYAKAIYVWYENIGGGSQEETKYNLTYNKNGGEGEMIDENSPYDSGSTVTVLNNAFTREGYAFTGFNTAVNGSGESYGEGDTFDISANTVLYAQWSVIKYPCSDENNQVTWDLSKATYDTMSDSEATWVSGKANITLNKGSGSYFASAYCPPEENHTRIYQNNTMTISPSSGYKINSITFTASTNNYASALKNSTWTNGTATVNNAVVTVIPTTKNIDISVTIGAATRLTEIVVNYAVYSPLDSIAISGSYQTSFNQGDDFNHEGMIITATYQNSSSADVTSSAVWSGYNMSNAGNQTITVSYTEDLVQKTTTYQITIAASPFITPDDASINGQVGNNESLSFTYGNLTEAINVVSSNISVATTEAAVYSNGAGTVQINYVGSGTTTILFKHGDVQLASVNLNTTRITKSSAQQILSADLTTTMNCTAGFDITKGDKTSKDSGYYKDGGTAESDLNFFMVKGTNPLFDNEQSNIEFTARLRGGTAKNPLDNNVEVCFVDSEGNEISSSKRVVTTKVSNSAVDYSVKLPYTANAYGVKLMHLKETSWNVYYYSFALAYDLGESIKTINGTENKTNDVVSSVSSVVLRFGVKISIDNWNALNSEHTISDYGVMFAREETLTSRSISSVKTAYETNESILYIVRKGSGTAPSASNGKYIFTAYLSITDALDYEDVFCATPFIVADGEYYFFDEMRYSVVSLASECESTHATLLSNEALSILSGN